MEINITDWGTTPEGDEIKLFTITGASGNSVSFTNYGATWVSASTPDRNGVKDDVISGFNDLQGYLDDSCYMGVTVGRFANRIKNGTFTIDGKKYQAGLNAAGKHCLHGGFEGLNRRAWDYETISDGVIFRTVSPDGDQGFPGELKVSVRYEWNDDNKLAITFEAETDKPTPVNLTNHAYFNLRGSGDILGHRLKIHAVDYLLFEEDCIISGEIKPVKGTPFDFTHFKEIGQDVDTDDEQIAMGRGYDHSFLIKTVDDGKSVLIAEACDPESGRAMKMYGTYPTVHLYTSNFLTSTRPGKKGKNHDKREAFCLEAQYAPNSPNLPDFPSCILYPGRKYEHRIEVEFLIK